MSEGDKDRCICCGAEFVDGKGFVEPHTFPCANERYGWAFTINDSDRKWKWIDEQTEITPEQWAEFKAFNESTRPHIASAPSPQGEQAPVKQTPGEHA